MAVIAVPTSAVREIADRLINAGIRGIVNFSSTIINCTSTNVYITNMDLINEFTLFSARIAIDNKKKHDKNDHL